jgi:hypothetical protein
MYSPISFPSTSFTNKNIRYIEQYQSLLTSSIKQAERKDLDTYQQVVRMATGDLSDTSDPPVDTIYTSYVQTPSSAMMSSENISYGGGGFNYEKWVATGSQRKATGDFLLGHL